MGGIDPDAFVRGAMALKALIAEAKGEFGDARGAKMVAVAMYMKSQAHEEEQTEVTTRECYDFLREVILGDPEIEEDLLKEGVSMDEALGVLDG